MKIEKKIWPDSFNAILDGTKTYEVRLNDFDCKLGDVLVLREWNPETKDYTGRVIERKVVRVSKLKDMKYWSQKDIDTYGFQVIGIAE